MTTIKIGFAGFGPRAQRLQGAMFTSGELLSDEVDEDGDPLPLFETVSCFDPSPDKQKGLPFGMVHFADLDAMLGAEGDLALDALVVASPPAFHLEQVLAGLQRGMHVFSEVPMALSIDDIHAIIDACKASPNARYMLGENYEYTYDVKYASALARDGKLGEIFYAEMEYMHDIRYRWFQPKGDSGVYAAGEDGKPKQVPWYSGMNPLMYAHSIGPLMKVIGHANGGRKPFISVNARGNQKVDQVTQAMNFTVAMFEMADETIARAANAMAIIRKPHRRCFNVYGTLGSFEAHEGDGMTPDREFLAPGASFDEFNATSIRAVPRAEMTRVGGPATELSDWADAIVHKKPAIINEIAGAEMCAAGICAATSAMTRKTVEIPSFR